MREYRAQLDAERARKLANGRNHSSSKSDRKKGCCQSGNTNINLCLYFYCSFYWTACFLADKKDKDLKKRSSSRKRKVLISYYLLLCHSYLWWWVVCFDSAFHWKDKNVNWERITWSWLCFYWTGLCMMWKELYPLIL